jgi:HEAT repeat protein
LPKAAIVCLLGMLKPLLCFLLTFQVATGTVEVTVRVAGTTSSHVLPAGVTRQAGGSITDLPGLIKNLYSTNQEDRRLTKLQILTIAKQSEENRAKISHELTALLSQRQTPSATWYDVADLLGELKATQAISELVRQLNYNDGSVGLSNSHWPAVRALIKIGDAAVPELARALNEGTEWIRGFAAQALGQIGGSEAKRALERALGIERHEGIREAIRRGLAQAK